MRRERGFFTCAGSSPQGSAPLRPVEILHDEYNIQLYVGIVKSSQNFSQVSVPSESEIFAFRSFCPISATTQYAPQTPYEIPPIVVKRLFKFRLKFEFVLKFVPHQMAIVVNDGIVKTTYALSFSSLKNKQTKNPKIINASP